MQVMVGEVRHLKQEPVPKPELEGDVSTFITGFMASNETTDGHAASLSRAQILGRDWRLIPLLPAKLRAETSAQIQDFQLQYLVNHQKLVIVDSGETDPAVMHATLLA